jgi:HMG-box domain
MSLPNNNSLLGVVTAPSMDRNAQQQLLLRALLQQQYSSVYRATHHSPPRTQTATAMQQLLQQRGLQEQQQQLSRLLSADLVRQQNQRAQLFAAAANANNFAPFAGSDRDLLQRLQQLRSTTLSPQSVIASSPVAPLLSRTSPTLAASAQKRALPDIYARDGSPSAGAPGLLSNLATSQAASAFHDTDLIASAALMETKIRKGRKKPKDHPRRPLSAYNIFFKEERQRILNEIPDASPEEKQIGTKTRKRKKNAHGKIGFENLAKAIGQKWQALNQEEIQYYKAQAEVDQKRYRDEMDVYNSSKKKSVHACESFDETVANSEESDDDIDSTSTLHTAKKLKGTV